MSQKIPGIIITRKQGHRIVERLGLPFPEWGWTTLHGGETPETPEIWIAPGGGYDYCHIYGDGIFWPVQERINKLKELGVTLRSYAIEEQVTADAST